jgi:hypothetical protein
MKWLGFGATNVSYATKLTGSKLAKKTHDTQLFYIMCWAQLFMDFQTFLSQCSKVGSTEVRTVVYSMAKWKATGEKGIHIYSHFVGVDSDSKDYFIVGNEVREIGNNISDYIEYGE